MADCLSRARLHSSLSANQLLRASGAVPAGIKEDAPYSSKEEGDDSKEMQIERPAEEKRQGDGEEQEVVEKEQTVNEEQHQQEKGPLRV